jgi:T5SS/PEP-CTERM-associated repeat protein
MNHTNTGWLETRETTRGLRALQISFMKTKQVWVFLTLMLLGTTGHGQVNSWINTSAGKWETNSNWSLGVAPTNTQSGTFFTNAFSKTVTIDAITSGTRPGTLTISNLTVSGIFPSTSNRLSLENSGTTTPLRLLNFLKIDSGGTLLVGSNSVVQVDNPTFTGFVNIDGGGFVQLLDGGALVATNQTTSLGLLTTGDILVNNGTLRTLNLSMGNFPGAIGTLRLQAGLAEVKSTLSLGASGGSTAAVWVTGGQLVATNAITTIGNASSGRLTVSNGTVNLGTVTVAQTAGTAGTLTVAGGAFTADRLVATNTSAIVNFTGGSTTLRGSEFPNNVGFFMGGDQIPSLNFPAGTNRFGNTMVLGPAGGGATLWVTGGHLVVTNGTTTIGDSTPFAQLTVSNGTWRARNVNLGRNIFSFGVLAVAGGDSSISSNLNLGDGLTSTGEVWMTGGQLAVTNAATIIGGRGTGRLTVSNGTFLAKTLLLGTNATGRGTLTIVGGTTTINGALFVTFAAGATSALWMSGGELNVTNSSLGIGINGVGFMTMSNGTCRALNFAVADSLGTAGTLTMAGGTNIISGDFHLGINANSTGTVWMSGGAQLLATNFTLIGNSGVGRMTISNGAHQARAMIIGNGSGGGTFSVAGGVSSVYSNLTVGFTPCTATGTVIVAGGSLFVTNVAGDATLDVRSGTLTISAGLLQANKIILTNPCAHYAYSGGIILYNTAVLNPNADDDGDGIPNSYEISHGLNALNPGNANQDTDGDGLTDFEEFLAGTDPTNNLSALRITSIVRTGNNVRITWATAGGRTNRVLVATPVPGGSFTNEFSNLSSFIIIPGSGDTSANYTDTGGATNVPSRYYRVRVVP